MKIKDFAVNNGVTKQAVYNAIKRMGLSTKELTDSTGNLTRKGISILSKHFSVSTDHAAQQDQPEQQEHNRQAVPEHDERDAEIDRLRNENDELRSKVDYWEKRYTELVDSSSSERERLSVLLDQEQKLRAMAENKGFIRRLFSGKKDEKKE